MKRWILAPVAVAAVIIGVTLVDRSDDGGGETNDGPITVDPSELVPATDGALAAVALEHVDATPSRSDPLHRPEDFGGPGTIGADIRFGSDGEYDGDLLRLVASPSPAEHANCADLSPCERIETDRGTVLLSWVEEAPEEDPGAVSVLLPLGDTYLRVYQAGQKITGDPRDLDLPISVDDMIAVITDPRYGLLTTDEMVDEGERLGL